MGYPPEWYSEAIKAAIEMIVDFHKWYPDLRIVVYTATGRLDLLEPVLDFAVYLDVSVGAFELAEVIKHITQ
ncbi:MAG: hypothetical protein FJ044_05515 [Candidatus Cloacimonetes bacterium]|nr:hypothetical protein [Candidatus Cloacimonadota bacterium]